MGSAPEVGIDETLVDRILAGDRSAAEEFAAVLRPRLLRWFLWLLRNREEAEDLAQDTFVRLWSALPNFRGESRMETWVYRIARHVYQNYLRHRQVEKEAAKSLPASEPGESVREATDKVTLRWALMDALAQLSEEERQAVTLVKVEGLTHKEAAAVLDEAEGTVCWRVFEALNKMRHLLESEEESIESTMPSS